MPDGPTLIFDKSLLQGLNPDEATWLDWFYLCNITPVFFVEVLADLDKKARGKRTPEEVVGGLAYKTPDLNSTPNVHHLTLLAAELSGTQDVDMRYGRPIVPQATTVVLGDQTGIVIKESPEQHALMRWQYYDFRAFERFTAKAWRAGLSGLDLEGMYQQFQSTIRYIGRPKSLLETKERTDALLASTPPEALLGFGLRPLGYSEEQLAAVISRWQRAGQPAISTFLPYFLHVLTVDTFFGIAVAADLISRDRPSHKVDLAYLYYLPFACVFTSSDKLHERIVPLFLKQHQDFIPGSTMKAELASIDQHYDAFPADQKARGLYELARYPPEDLRFLITRHWDRYLPPWREHKARYRTPDQEIGDDIKELMKRLENAPPATGPVEQEDAAYMTSSRRVRMKQGKWNRFPPEVKPGHDHS